MGVGEKGEEGGGELFLRGSMGPHFSEQASQGRFEDGSLLTGSCSTAYHSCSYADAATTTTSCSTLTTCPSTLRV